MFQTSTIIRQYVFDVVCYAAIAYGYTTSEFWGRIAKCE